MALRMEKIESAALTALALSFGGCHAPLKNVKPQSQTLQPQTPPSLQVKNTPVCYYQILTREKPFDFNLWRGQRSCGKDTCAPPLPKVLATKEEIRAFEASATPPTLKKLPADVDQLRSFLFKAEKEGRLTWVSPSNRAIYDVLRGEVKSTPAGEDVNFVLGISHGAPEQLTFITKLFEEWKNGEEIEGDGHILFEIDRMSDEKTDLQLGMDRYLVTGDTSTLPELFSVSLPESQTYLEVIQAYKKMLTIARGNCYDVIFADSKGSFSEEDKQRLGRPLRNRSREIYALQTAGQRNDPAKKDVFWWIWGSDHAEKYGIPLDIHNAKVRSIVFNGGRFAPFLIFDQTLKNMGNEWLEKAFILALDGYREADYVVHLPSNGKMIDWEIDPQGEIVLQGLRSFNDNYKR